MFTRKPRQNPGLEMVIDKLQSELITNDYDVDEYAKQVKQLAKLYKLKEHDAPKRVSPDTAALVAGNLAGIVLIVGYERAHVVTSKALGFVLKLR